MALAAALVAVLGSGAAAAQEPQAEPVRMVMPESVAPVTPLSRDVALYIDFAEILQIPGDVSAVVLGNSEIADASVVATGTIALTGKAIGSTNVVILSSDGTILTELQIRVQGHKPGTVTVRRALLASNYACTESFCRYNGDGPERVAAAE